ncbi:hypothetical protein C2845_PM09G20210 [Panicum miliaceum]|uniref:Uncharacterized protein n=1 Tax=Panicum miliaceum TaxID=4540 RepID=A0A3L6S129_PANMI|nr:hypothetical protein C2845_PM09G20210 [Panicum miliaceum]
MIVASEARRSGGSRRGCAAALQAACLAGARPRRPAREPALTTPPPTRRTWARRLDRHHCSRGRGVGVKRRPAHALNVPLATGREPALTPPSTCRIWARRSNWRRCSSPTRPRYGRWRTRPPSFATPRPRPIRPGKHARQARLCRSSSTASPSPPLPSLRSGSSLATGPSAAVAPHPRLALHPRSSLVVGQAAAVASLPRPVQPKGARGRPDVATPRRWPVHRHRRLLAACPAL